MSSLRVLIAEDDRSIRTTLELFLEDEGFDVLVAPDGNRAVELARSAAPDVILLDHHMPGLDGRQVFTALRGDEATAEIPVIVLSGSEPSTNRWAGAHFLGKPFELSQLIDTITSLTGGRR